MSDVDKDDLHREYLPLVNTRNSQTGDEKLFSRESENVSNPMVNNKSILSVANQSDRELQKRSQIEETPDTTAQQTFYQKNKKIIKIAGGILLLVAIILAIVLPLTLHKDDPYIPPTPDEPTQPDPFFYQEFNPFYVDATNPPEINTFDATFNLYYNYSSFNDSQQNNTNITSLLPEQLRTFMGYDHDGVTDDHVLNGTNYRPMNPRYILNSSSNMWAQNLNIKVEMNNNNQARVILTNPHKDPGETLRRQVNSNLFPRPKKEIEARLQQVGFSYNQTSSFAFNFSDIYTKETLVTTMYRKMVVTDMYSQIGFVLPNQRCFGLGQRNGKFQVDSGTYTFNARAREESLPQDDGLGGKSGNHIHPFMLCQTAVKKDFFGMFFVSNGPQVFEIVKFYNSTQMVLNYITVSGVIEFYVLVRGTAQEVISRYHNMIGTPMLPPYYSLGVFHGSNSYKKWSDFQSVYDNYNGAATGAKQALEGVFVEDFNQQSHWTFTVNTDNYPNLAAAVDAIHANNQRVIFGASLAISSNSNYPWYKQASQSQCLVRSFSDVAVGSLTGILDQTEVQYLDSFSQCFDSFLAVTLPAFNKATAHGLDGLIVKDSHMPNHINGQLRAPASEEISERRVLLGDAPVVALNEEMVGFYSPYQVYNNSEEAVRSTYYLPFIPAFKYSGPLDNMTTSLNATFGDDLGGGRYSGLYARNGFAGYALKRTYNGVQNAKNATGRALLFSDASWSGSGAYSAALLTDQQRSWSDMQNVIGQVIALSMYGMSATMVDTCGSLGPQDEDLCTRWTQLATFMPLVRNYYNSTYLSATGERTKTPGTEPWNAQSDQAKLAYAALGDRLKLSRYIYTQMYLTHANGGSLVKPLFFDFPHDEESFSHDVISSTYMLGDSVKVSPLLQSKKDGDTYTSYFPQGVWVDLYNPANIITAPAGGVNATLPVTAASTNIHQKAGTILPWLNNNKNLRTTREVELGLRTQFRIVRDPVTNYAEGHIMIDDGVSPNLYSPSYMDTYDYKTFDKNFTHFNIRYAANKTINFMMQNGDVDYKGPESFSYQYLDQIDIMNAQDIADSDFACSLNKSWVPLALNVFYTESTKTLTIKPVSGSITFDQLLLVQFGNKARDISYCNGFTYSAKITDEEDDETFVQYQLASSQVKGAVEDLYAEFTLLDNEGSILVEITTASDFNSKKTKLFRPPQPEYYNIDNFNKMPVTKKLAQFLQVDTQNFAYKINNLTGGLVYQSDPFRLFVTDHFVVDSGIFQTNALTGHPLLGIGERAGKGLLKNQKDSVHTIWPQDQPNPIDEGKPPGKNLYGYQPIYYYQAATTDWIAVFDIGTYPSDYFVNTDTDGMGTNKITKVTVGGLIQKVFIQAPRLEEAIRKYQRLTGFQTVAPMWAFGWNQCKFGYYEEEMWWAVYQNYKKFNIPLDTMWADIDYMDDYKVFTISNQTYPDLPDSVKEIHSEGRYFVPIIDNAIAVRKDMGYEAFDEGMKQNVFIMKADLSGPATGAVWPGLAYYPDFFKTETVTWWQSNLDTFKTKLPFDGIWLDMNEPSSTCTGYCDQTDRPVNSIKYKIPYLPGQRDLEVQALGLDTVNTGLPATGDTFRNHLDTRSLYALKESQTTYQYLAKDGKRPFVLSRSNSPGLQKYGFHWIADNWSQQEWMETSIDSIYSYNLFGIPMMGSDICGFNLDASPQLCTRWHQLGSFYPFARNHKNSVWKQIEPYQFNFTGTDIEDGRTYTDLIRTALLQRYSLLRYTYSNFHQIGEFGGSYFKPLYYEFQDDANTFDEVSTQRNIMLGSALKLSIQVHSFDQVSTEYLFPSSRWCQVMPTIDPTKCWDTSNKDSTTQRLDSGITDYQVHLRGGSIIPFQDAISLKVNKSLDLMTNPTELIVLTNAANSAIVLPSGQQYTAQAAGFIYLDDGFSQANIARFDISVESQVDGTFTIKVHKIKDIPQAQHAACGKAATLSAVTLLWASGTGYSQIKSAKLIQSAGGNIDLVAPTWDQATDTLRVNLTPTTGGQTWTFWDITSISLSN